MVLLALPMPVHFFLDRILVSLVIFLGIRIHLNQAHGQLNPVPDTNTLQTHRSPISCHWSCSWISSGTGEFYSVHSPFLFNNKMSSLSPTLTSLNISFHSSSHTTETTTTGNSYHFYFSLRTGCPPHQRLLFSFVGRHNPHIDL